MLNSTLLIIALLLPANAFAEVLDFPILSTSKGNMYRSTNLQSQLEKEYGFSLANGTVLLVETPSFKNTKYIKQNKDLDSWGHEVENLQLIFIISCNESKYEHGYHTAVNVAKKLNPKNKFRIRFLSINGRVLYESGKPLSQREIKEILNKIR